MLSRKLILITMMAFAFFIYESISRAELAPNREQHIRELLRAFEGDAAQTMRRPPLRRDADGNLVPRDQTHFSRREVESGAFIHSKILERQSIIRRNRAPIPEMPGLAAPYQENDLVEDLVDDFKYNNLRAMERDKLTKAELSTTPWSGDYWPLYSGVIAKRYSGPYPSADWKKNFDRFNETADSTSLDQLSPAEKYDLVVGDPAKTLTAAMWNEGKAYYDQFGKVETWMGICHGWAPASYMMARPEHTVEVLAADGQTKIRFNPTDIKALETLLWAKSPTQTRLISGRCNDKDPEADANGRILKQECFDTNPGTWHMAIVNQVGHSKRAFVMDATYDYQVWNQPVYGYSYTYFNPKTRDTVQEIEKARVALADFSEDKFQKYRSTETVYLVGVAMDVTYGVENGTSPADNDSPTLDRQNTVTYLYDLELDRSGKILGGEWYQRQHPDFLWTPARGTHAASIGDRMLDSRGDTSRWDSTERVPELWQRAARSSSRRGQPLARVVEALVTISNANSNNIEYLGELPHLR